MGGLFGYSYAYLGDLEAKIDMDTTDFGSLIKKLHMNRVDLFVEQYEILAGFAAAGQPYLKDTNLGFAKVPGLEPTYLNMMISRNYENALELKRILAEGLLELHLS